ncbi:MAG: DUF3795 domain-containing protein [Bacteroidales bacterium]|jgi:hypothetical protein|nr:DUF3795 domain-containing protein [Bacteroidales bacterium]
MDRKYACYCGLYCENCAVKVKVEPAAKVLYEEMNQLGFAEIMQFFPDGENFWSFLKSMSAEGVCISCKTGSGNPACKIRLCAKGKNLEICAMCNSYPCEYFTEFFTGYPALRSDNAVLREKGWEAWAKLQDKRRTEGCASFYDKNSNEPNKI